MNNCLTLDLCEQQETLALIETASGGLIAASILSIPGASRVFNGGINAYSLPTRKAFLDWTEEDSKSYQYVSLFSVFFRFVSNLFLNHNHFSENNFRGPTIEIVRNLALALQKKVPSTYILSESAVAGPTLPPVYRKSLRVGYVPTAIVGKQGEVWFEGETYIDVEKVGQNEGTGSRGGMMIEIAKVGMIHLETLLKKREEEERGKL